MLGSFYLTFVFETVGCSQITCSVLFAFKKRKLRFSSTFMIASTEIERKILVSIKILQTKLYKLAILAIYAT